MQLKVVCLNLWLGGEPFDPILDFLKKENAEILLLQEARSNKNPNLGRQYRSAEVLKAELKYDFGAFSPAFFENIRQEKIDFGNAVLSRFPITGTEAVFYDLPYGEVNESSDEVKTFTPRNLQKVAIEIGGKKLNVFNTQGIWGVDGRDNERRLKMSETIVNEIENKENIILGGDFNINPDTRTIANIEKHLKNVFKDELTTSFNMLRKKDNRLATVVVDMVFVSNNIKITDHYCPRADVSDHLPLVCTLEI